MLCNSRLGCIMDENRIIVAGIEALCRRIDASRAMDEEGRERPRDTNYCFAFLMMMVWCVRLDLFGMFHIFES